METHLEIKKERFLQAVQNILDRTRMFEDRFVIFEKWIEPSEVRIPKDEVYDEEGFFGIFRNRNYAYMLWHNRSGELHSYNDMPSKISLSCDYRELNLEWHKNGEPFRSNNKFNKFSYYLPSLRFSNTADELQYTAEWFNKKGELHSYNDMPAKITQSTIEWYWNGQNCRMSYSFDELPCIIDKMGHMTFRRHKNDSSETVNYPFSTKYYGIYVLSGLYKYEKYVKWPIRQMLTL